nr:MAG TPA: GTP Cyclohydrolase I [Caudoviricetes sp.]
MRKLIKKGYEIIAMSEVVKHYFSYYTILYRA